jgi:hypothetical protein
VCKRKNNMPERNTVFWGCMGRETTNCGSEKIDVKK